MPDDVPPTNRMRLVTVGDGECEFVAHSPPPKPFFSPFTLRHATPGGKTALLSAFADPRSPLIHIPTVFDLAGNGSVSFLDEQTGKEVVVQMTLCDTAGQEGFVGLRPISYEGADVVALCFEVAKPETLENVARVWAPELYNHVPDVPVVLVACNTDLRDDLPTIKELALINRWPVTREEGEEMATRIGARAYVECSAVRNMNVGDVFVEAARAALDTARRRKEPTTNKKVVRRWSKARWRFLGEKYRAKLGKFF
ncbi:GTP-binding protein Rho1 [Irineochytrium annulatum]|nr:GTP-binding protein Rho1 [Irineochytrium annulatum]